jgi:glycosyltransferase involved in cell wall biosynthesis
VRREILALESAGLTIFRVSIRQFAPEQVDAADSAEAQRTEVILKRGLLSLLPSFARELLRPHRLLPAILEAIRAGMRTEAGALKSLVYLIEAAKLRQICVARGVDHIHAHFGTNPAEIARLCRRLGGPSFSFTIHGPDELDRVTGFDLPTKIREASFTAAISEFGRSQLRRFVPQSLWSRITVVHCGLDGVFFDRQRTPVPDTDQVLFLGRLAPQKDPLLLVEAAAVLRNRGRRLRVRFAGSGDLEPAIRRRISELKMDDDFCFLGSVDQATAAAELESARALVLPSSAEGLPVVIMEAMSLGRPVVSTYVNGIPELVRTGREGWLSPCGDVERLADSLEALLDASPEQLEEIGDSCYARVRKRHDIRVSAEKLARRFRAAIAD